MGLLVAQPVRTLTVILRSDMDLHIFLTMSIIRLGCLRSSAPYVYIVYNVYDVYMGMDELEREIGQVGLGLETRDSAENEGVDELGVRYSAKLWWAI